jgi:hypothetical protein
MPPGQGWAQTPGYQPPPRATDGGPPVPAPAEPAQQTAANPASSANLMRTVILVLSVALLLLVVFDGIAVLEGKTASDLNSLVSLIAGGFIGYLTPHAVGAAKSDGADDPGNQ